MLVFRYSMSLRNVGIYNVTTQMNKIEVIHRRENPTPEQETNLFDLTLNSDHILKPV
jgi:hypothetical protein